MGNVIETLRDHLPMSRKNSRLEIASLKAAINQASDQAALAETMIRELTTAIDAMQDTMQVAIQKMLAEELLSRERIQANIDSVYSKAVQIENASEATSKSIADIQEVSVSSISATKDRTFIEHLDYHLVDHCNLNCKTCSVFSPLAKKTFADIDSFESDMLRLHELIGERVLRIHLMGGEPLLHPEVEQFVRLARSIFREAHIDITTNGLLITKMSDSFWDALKESNVAIKYTRYPVDYDYDAMVNFVRNKEVSVFSAAEGTVKSFRKIPLNPKGVFNACRSYLQCPYVDCAQLKQGRLYRCPASAYSEILNSAMMESGMDKKFTVMPNDYLDLSIARSANEVFDFASGAIPFCRYCDMRNIDNQQPWGHSTKDIREWLDFSSCD